MHQLVKRGQTTTEYLFLIVGIIIFVVLIYTLLKGNVVTPQQNRTSDDMVKWLKNTEAVIFFDNFDSGTSEQWTVVTGNWLVENKEYLQKDASASQKGSIAGKNSWVNYFAETKFLIPILPASNGPLGGISGRVNKASGARYSCIMELTDFANKKGKIALNRFYTWQGTPDKLAESAEIVFDNSFHILAIQLNGNTVNCFLDDAQMLSYNDSTPFKYGLLALESSNSEAHFDSVRAKYQDGPNPLGPNPTPTSSATPTPTPTSTPTPSPTPTPQAFPLFCSDAYSTQINHCSTTLPEYCDASDPLHPAIINKCNPCGCPIGKPVCNDDGSCSTTAGYFIYNVLTRDIIDESAYVDWNTTTRANSTVHYWETGTIILEGQKQINFEGSSGNIFGKEKQINFEQAAPTLPPEKGSEVIVEDGNQVTWHSLQLTHLLPGTDYTYYVSSCNATFCNSSAEYAFTTLRDYAPPVDNRTLLISNVTNYSITYSSARVSWQTDLYSNSSVEYGETNSYGLEKNWSDNVLFHALYLGNLKNFTTYHYRVSSCNATLCNSSSDYTFKTLQRQFCSETDGGIVPNVTGATTNSTGTVNDICTNSTRLMEYFCSSTDGQVVYTFANCQSCGSGACTGAFCADYDRTVVTNAGIYADTCHINGAYDYYCNGIT
jgi:hypothetical protein